MKIALCLVISLFCAAGGIAADCDGDGVADEFTIIRDAAKVAAASGIQLVNPWWQNPPVSNQKPKGLGLRIRLSRASQTYLLHDPDFFSQPIWIVWIEGKPPVRVITRKEGCAIWRMEKAGARSAGRCDRARHRGGHRHPALLEWQTVAHLFATGGPLNRSQSSSISSDSLNRRQRNRIVEALARAT
jgi:hypothetical protein